MSKLELAYRDISPSTSTVSEKIKAMAVGYKKTIVIAVIVAGILLVANFILTLVTRDQTTQYLSEFITRNQNPFSSLTRAEYSLLSNSTRSQKKFIYLTQTESCLNDYLRSHLSNPTSCQCDILVLSWKEKCSDSSLPHVEYIFDTNTTFTTGRNLLYRSVMKREQKYLYYTFFDDDVTMAFKKEPHKNADTWREYEKSLLRVRPLIAVSWDYALTHFKKYYDGGCNYDDKPDYLPFVWYDALFDSFHSEVINYLLPYYDKMEKTSIWFSQLYLIMKTDLMFPGQVFHHLNVLISNPLHRPYARKMFDSNTVREFLDDLKNEIPAKYREQLQPKLEDWVKNVKQKEAVKYHCPVYPAVLNPIVPYGYLDSAVGN